MKRIIKCLIALFIFGIFFVFGLNFYVTMSTKKLIKTNEFEEADAIIVLGAGIRNNKPSPMLKDRLDKAIELYNDGISKKIIMSGDHGREYYDEVNVMKKYAIDAGVPSEDIFMDHAGFSTYDTIVRAKEIFKVKKAVIVTQKYHLYRALYIAYSFGIDAYGVNAEEIKYSGRTLREVREVIARDKDFFKCILKPNPTYLGEEIPVTANGDITND